MALGLELYSLTATAQRSTSELRNALTSIMSTLLELFPDKHPEPDPKKTDLRSTTETERQHQMQKNSN